MRRYACAPLGESASIVKQCSSVPAAATLIQRIAALILLALCLVSCGDTLDPQEVRTCRQTLPAVSLDADKIIVTKVSAVDAPYTMRIDYHASVRGIPGTYFVLCGFGSGPRNNSPIELVRLTTGSEVFSPLQMHILRRYWLNRHEYSYIADPGPGETQANVPEVPRNMAYLVQSFGNGLPMTAMTMLIAVAYALVFGLVRRINLAFGDFAALGGIVTVAATLTLLALGSTTPLFDLSLVIVATLSFVVLIGYVVERLVFAPLAFRRGQTILIATVAVAIVMRETMRLVEGPENRWIPPITGPSLSLVKADGFVATITVMQIIIGLTATVIALCVVLLMHHSEFGRRWRAISDDAMMANLIGVSSRRMLAQTFVLASALAGFAGFIMTTYYGGVDAYSGAMIGLKGLVAAVIGGIGSIEGALLGGLALGLFEMIWQAYFPIEHRDVAVMVVLVVMLVFRPGGLFGFADATPREV